MLVEAFARLQIQESQLVIAGPDDGQLAEIQELVRYYGLDERVLLPGLLCGQDVLSAFQDADLFVLPSRADSFPVTVMESCLMGTPMVITDRCNIAHLINNSVGEVVPFDAQKFAEAIRLLLTDQERYDRYKFNTHALVANTFSIQAVVDRLETVYHSVVAEKDKK
jgi:glycosyltransferase involved in cell wall biosynthesis